MTTSQTLLEQSTEKFCQLALIALARSAGGKLYIADKSLADAEQYMLQVSVGSSGSIMNLVKKTVTGAQVDEYFDNRVPLADSRVVVSEAQAGQIGIQEGSKPPGPPKPPKPEWDRGFA